MQSTEIGIYQTENWDFTCKKRSFTNLIWKQHQHIFWESRVFQENPLVQGGTYRINFASISWNHQTGLRKDCGSGGMKTSQKLDVLRTSISEHSKCLSTGTGSPKYYPVVTGGSDSELGVFIFPILGPIYSLLNGEPRSYMEFPNHLVDRI